MEKDSLVFIRNVIYMEWDCCLKLSGFIIILLDCMEFMEVIFRWFMWGCYLMVLILWFDMDDIYDLERVIFDRNYLCVNWEDM